MSSCDIAKASMLSKIWPVIGSGGGVWIGIAIVLFAGVAAYSNSFDGAFVFDDRNGVAENPRIHKLWPIWHFFVQSEGDIFWMSSRPALAISFAINYAIGGKSTFGYHAVNLAIHLLAAMALFGILRRTLGASSMSPSLSRAAVWLATVIATIWVVHPLNTSAVTYIYQRAESMMGLCYLATLYFSIRAMEVTGSFSRWHVAAIVVCAIGMACKETMVSCPVLVLLYDLIFVESRLERIFRSRWKLYVGLAACWVVLAGCVFSGGVRGGTETFAHGITSLEYAQTQPGVILHYIMLSFWPVNLSIDYKWPIAGEWGEIIPGLIVVCAIISVTLLGLLKRPAFGFCGVFFIAILGVTSSFLPISEIACEYRMYLPLAAIVSVVVLAAYLILIRLARSQGRAMPAVAIFASLILCVTTFAILVFLTISRNWLYHDPLLLWKDAVEKQPANYRAWINVAAELTVRDNLKEAEVAANNAVALSLANVIDESNYRKLSMYQRYCVAEAYVDRGGAMLQINHKDRSVVRRAIADFDRAIIIRPLPLAYSNRGDALVWLGEHRKAIADYRKAIDMGGGRSEIYCNMGLAYEGLGDYANALESYGQAIKLNPDYSIAYYNRAVCRFFMRDYDAAWRDLLACKKMGGKIDPKFIDDLSAASGKRF